MNGCDLSLILFFTKYHFYFIKNYLIRQSEIEQHLQKNLTLERESSKVKISESIRGTKEVQENLTFVYGSVKKKNGVKEEVLECQLVTTS